MVMSTESQNELVLYFMLGGIHGLPNIEWDGSGTDQSAFNQWGGYCVHGCNLFPTWHRSYMALIEFHAMCIVDEYMIDKDTFKRAAIALRFPYWDWASNAVPPSEVISFEQVEIITPKSNGKKVLVANPIFAYGFHFHPIDKSFVPPFSQWPKTLRHPTSPDADATTDVKSLIQTLQSAA